MLLERPPSIFSIQRSTFDSLVETDLTSLLHKSFYRATQVFKLAGEHFTADRLNKVSARV